jgi:hypothetical protein
MNEDGKERRKDREWGETWRSNAEEIGFSMIQVTRWILRRAQGSYRAERVGESPRGIDAVRVGCPITTGSIWASWSFATVG